MQRKPSSVLPGPRELLLGLLLLVAGEVAMVALYVADVLLHQPSDIVHSLFDLDAELTIPAWFSSMQLAAIGMLLGLLLFQNRSVPGMPLRVIGCMAAGFIILSADEVVAIHERITPLLRHVAWLPRFRGQFGIWIFLYGVAGFAFLLCARKGLLSLWRHLRLPSIVMMLGAAVYLAGSFALEVLSYLYLRPLDPSALRYEGGALQGASGMYHLEVAAEEFLEMFGATIMLYAAAMANLSRRDLLPAMVPGGNAAQS